MAADAVTRWRLAGQATVPLGDGSRGGLTRGAYRACAHALGVQETYLPCGLVDAESGQRSLTCGSSYQTSDGMVDALEAWWTAWETRAQVAMARRQITMDNGPESRGRRTPLLQRLRECGAALGQPRHLLDDPPSHRKYTPLARCWGSLALPWHGTKLVDVETMLAWAKRRTWRGMHPSVALSRNIDQKGVTLSKRAMRMIAARLERHPE